MRTIHATLILGILVSGCGGGAEEAQPPVTPPPAATVASATPAPAQTLETPKPAEAPKPSMSEMQKTAIQGITDAFNAHDAAKIASFYADDAKMTQPGMPDTTGRDAIQKDMSQLLTSFPNMKYGVAHVWAKGPVAITEWAWSGKNTGEMMGQKPTEKEAGTVGASVAWFNEEGKIKEEHVYMDMGTMMSQLGMGPKGGPKPRAVPAIPTTTEWIVAKGTPEEEKNVELMKSMNSAFEKGTKGSDEFVGTLAEGIEWDENTSPAPMKGKDAAKKFFQGFVTAFPDLKATPSNVWGIGDFVIAESKMTGTHKGKFAGLAPTNKAIEVHGLDIALVKEGKMVKGWSFANGAEMATQLGLLKPPAPAGAKSAAPASTGEKKAAPAGGEKKVAPAGDKKPAAASDKKPAPAGDKKAAPKK